MLIADKDCPNAQLWEYVRTSDMLSLALHKQQGKSFDVALKVGDIVDTLLNLTINLDKMDVVEFLLENGADPKYCVREHITAPHLQVILHNNMTAVALFKNYGAYKKLSVQCKTHIAGALSNMCFQRDHIRLKTLCAMGFAKYINFSGESGYSALKSAIIHNSLECAEVLLEYGADPTFGYKDLDDLLDRGGTVLTIPVSEIKRVIANWRLAAANGDVNSQSQLRLAESLSVGSALQYAKDTKNRAALKLFAKHM